MKLRLSNNALRLRLSQTDVARFESTGCVEEAVLFPGAVSLAWILEASTAVQTPEASFDEKSLRVRVPLAQARQWVTSSDVGIYLPATAAGPAIAVEKDFQCLHERRSDDPSHASDADSFPNPAAVRRNSPNPEP